MNNKYVVVNLRDALDELRLERVENILSSFSCRLNNDIERFLKDRAIEFSNQGVTQTHLVMEKTANKDVLLGYFALTNKVLPINPENVSNALMKKIARFGVPDENTGVYNLPIPLIAQLGKNFSDNLNLHISGKLLLEIACGKIAAIQRELSGKLVYIECEDTPKLANFYSENQFRDIGGGKPNPSNGLLQMIRYL